MFSVMHSGTWKRGRPHVLVGSTWVPAQRAHVLWPDSGSIDPPELVWMLADDWRVPTESVPDPQAVRSQQITPPEAAIVWSVVSSKSDLRYYYAVRVEWYLNSVHIDTETLWQGTGGTDFKSFTAGDAVYAVVRYETANGFGPSSMTNVLVL